MWTRTRGPVTGSGGIGRRALCAAVGLVIGALLTSCAVASPPALSPAPEPALVPIPAPPRDPVRLPAPIATPAPAPPAAPERRELDGSYAQAPAALLAASTARRLYVSPAGSDRNNGSSDSPFRTITRAAAAATPGTTVLVADGTYGGPFATRVSGRPNARISFVAMNKWAAKLVGKDDGGDAVWRNFGNYVDIQGFDISGSLADGIIQTGSHGRILENRVHGLTEGCIATYRDDYSMVDNDIIGNVVFGCGTNLLHHGIYPGGSGGTISNNIAYGNAGFGIHCWHACNRQVITNNLVFDNDEGGILIGQGDGPNNGDVAADNMLVANNIVIGNGGDEGIRESGATGSRNRYVNNNVVGNAAGGIGLRTGDASGTVEAQPGFVNFRADGRGDYRLQPGSPNLDAGTANGAPEVDIVGVPRGQGGRVDIGPFEQ